MNSSPTIVPPSNINFIGRGLEGIRKMKNAQQLLVESPAAAKPADLLISSAANSPLLGFFVPQAPAAQKPPANKRRLPALKITMKNNKIISIKYPDPPQQQVVAPVPPPDYKNELLSDKKLVVSSVNCAFKIIGEHFYKIQISESADPLINEVIFTRILSESGKFDIFPKYVDHFTVAGSDKGNETPTSLPLSSVNPKIIDFAYKNYKVLVTKTVKNAASLSDVLKKTTDKSKIVAKIEALMTAYESYGKTLNFIHGDLHMTNIQIENGSIFDGNNSDILSPKIIDFGRCFIRDEESIKSAKKFTIGLSKEIDFADDFNKFNIPKTIDFENEWRLVNIKKDEKYLLGNCGYLCDVAQVAFNLLLSGAIKNDKPWFKLAKYDNGNRDFIHIDFSKIPLTTLTTLDHGFIWLSSYLYACKTEIYNIIKGIFGQRIQNMNTVLGQKVLLSDNGSIIQFDLSRLMSNTLLIKNGMFNPSIFSDDDLVQDLTYKKYREIVPEKSSVKGGSNKNLISLHKKSNRSKKMNGGNRKNYVNIMNGIDMSDELSSSSDIFKHTLHAHEPIHSSEILAIDNSPDYYTPLPSSEINLDDLGKSITQIFFEELQKTKIFKSEFTVEEIENSETNNTLSANTEFVSTPEKACLPCPKNEIIVNDLKRFRNSVEIGVSFKTNPLESRICCSGRNATRGGSSSKNYKIYVCSETNRKYIRKSNERWYLDENRGKYRYSDEKKTKITVLGA